MRCQTELNRRWKLRIRDVRDGCHLCRGLEWKKEAMADH